MNCLKLALFIGVLSSVTSCTTNYTVSTNLDKQNFTDYFAPSKVTIYEKESEIKGAYKALGLIEGEDCQLKAHLAAPDKVLARTHARAKAYELGANGIIFSGCAMIESQHCIAQLVCYGQMYKVEVEVEKE